MAAETLRSWRVGGEVMKRTLIIVCMVAMVFALVASAYAESADTKWRVYIRTGIGPNATNLSAGYAQLGVQTSSLGWAAWPENVNPDKVQVNVITPTIVNAAQWTVAPSTQNIRWDIYIWNKADGISEVKVKFWNPSGLYDLSGTDVVQLWDPDQAGDGPDGSKLLFTIDNDINGNGKDDDPGTFGWTITVPENNSMGTLEDPTGKHYIVTCNYTPDIPEIPEPGSILALMSGIVGFAGVAIRRRK